MTMIVASDSMTPLTTLVVTASSGHRPRIWTSEVFCFQTPLPAMVLNSSRVIICSLPFSAKSLSRLASAHFTAFSTALVTARGVTVAPA